MSKLCIETHTRLIREVKKAKIRLNLLIGLKGIKGIKYKNRISCIKSVKMENMVDILLRLYYSLQNSTSDHIRILLRG